MARPRGMGCLYRRGRMVWIKYSVHGRAYQESSRSTKVADATRLLQQRLGEVAEGRFMGPQAERVSLRELCDDFITDYQINGRRSLDKARRSVRHLLAFFGVSRALAITTAQVRAYIAARQAQGTSSAGINRELAALKRAFRLGLQAGKLPRSPYIPTLREDNVRQGFFEPGEFVAVRTTLPDDLQPVLTFGYLTGWRKQEVLTLQWRQVDREAGVVRLEPGTTKEGEGRLLMLEGELRQVIEGQWQRRRLGCPYVFNRDGRPIRDFRKAWARALRETGLAGKLFHDLRRTAVRNLVRAGVPERVAMQLSGHKTRSVFDRYHIVSEADLHEAAQRLDAHHQARLATATVQVLPLRRAGEPERTR